MIVVDTDDDDDVGDGIEFDGIFVFWIREWEINFISGDTKN